MVIQTTVSNSYSLDLISLGRNPIDSGYEERKTPTTVAVNSRTTVLFVRQIVKQSIFGLHSLFSVKGRITLLFVHVFVCLMEPG
jgi:hypothetical protein